MPEPLEQSAGFPWRTPEATVLHQSGFSKHCFPDDKGGEEGPAPPRKVGEPARLGSLPGEVQPGRAAIDEDVIALGESALQDLERERILDLPLDGPLERPAPKAGS